MARLLKVLCALLCVALVTGCAYEQDAGQALTPDELSLLIGWGESEMGDVMGVSMPDADTRAYGVELTWYLK